MCSSFPAFNWAIKKALWVQRNIIIINREKKHSKAVVISNLE
jgi:hypothetical protein